ncbi:outer dense fiber protein 4 [Glossophaga mutica]
MTTATRVLLVPVFGVGRFSRLAHHLRQEYVSFDSSSTSQMQMEIKHTSQWRGLKLASGLSLIAFILLLIMAFSTEWLYLSSSRFYQRWPKNVTCRIYTSAVIMSMGLLQICKSKKCPFSENRKDSFKLWTNHPVFGMAKTTFIMALVLGFIFTIWLHLLYIPGLQRVPYFGWIGIFMSFCEVVFIFSTLLLFPVNVWIFELKRNLSIPIGWSYFIGWVVFVLYVTCAVLCYFDNKNVWSPILSYPSGTVSYNSSTTSVSPNEQSQASSSSKKSWILSKKRDLCNLF